MGARVVGTGRKQNAKNEILLFQEGDMDTEAAADI